MNPDEARAMAREVWAYWAQQHTEPSDGFASEVAEYFDAEGDGLIDVIAALLVTVTERKV